MMIKKLCYSFISIILLVACTLSVSVSAANQSTKGEVSYSDLFYKYDTSYLSDEKMLKTHIKQTSNILADVYNDYADSNKFLWTTIKSSLAAATDLKKWVELISSANGGRDYIYENALDKANQIFAEELLEPNEDANSFGAGADLLGFCEDLFEVYNEFNKSFDVYKMTDYEIYYEYFAIIKNKGIFSYLGYARITDIEKIIMLDLEEHTDMLSITGNALEAAQALSIGLMMENLRFKIIDEVVASAPKNSTIYEGMLRLQSQLSNKFTSYFISQYVERGLLKEFGADVMKALLKAYSSGMGSAYTLVTSALNLASMIAFDIIADVPSIDDMTVQKVLTEYSSDLYDLLKVKISGFKTEVNADKINGFELVFDSYIAATNAALDQSQSLALDSNRPELDGVTYVWKDYCYSMYIEHVIDSIETTPDSERKIKQSSELPKEDAFEFETPGQYVPTPDTSARDKAVAWAKSKIGVGLDFDGNGYWCVDPIFYYYEYLGVGSYGGNACDYISNSLPSGWERITYYSGMIPQPGDIAVWKTNANGTSSLGHVGIITNSTASTMTVVNQRYNGQEYCTQNDFPTYVLQCVIRPNFNTSSNVSVKYYPWSGKQNIGIDNAVLATRAELINANNRQISVAGIKLYDRNNNLLASTVEDATKANLGGEPVVYINYDIKNDLGYTLSADTTYKYKFFVEINGTTYYGDLCSFTTESEEHTHLFLESTCATCGFKKAYITSVTSTPSAAINGTVSVTVNAVGEGLTYEWYYKNKGASTFTCTSSFTGNTYATTMTAARDGRQVYCVVTDKYGNTATSEVVTFKMTASLKITKQPTDVVVAEGKSFAVTVEATGENLSYNWYFKNSGASNFTYTPSFTGNTYSTTMTAAREGRQIYCEITDEYGNTVRSEVVTLYMQTPLKINSVSAVKTAALNGSVRVKVNATGDALTYKWYYKDKGASAFTLTNTFKGATYETTMTAARNGRQVYCVVTDDYGNSVKSETVTLTLNTNNVKINSVSSNVKVKLNASASITVNATGEGLTYKWYYKSAGASAFSVSTSITGKTYSTPLTEARNGRQVYCVVTDKYGNKVQTETYTLTIINPAKISKVTAVTAAKINGSVSVTVKATGDGLTYKWYYKDKGMTAFKYTSSFKGNSYATILTDARVGRQVYCEITDKYGNVVKTETYTFIKMVPVKITGVTANASAKANGTVSVTVNATGEGLKYKWYFRNKGISTYTLTTSFTGNTYSTAMNASRDGRQVYCVVTDKYGNTVKSAVVTLTMTK